MRMISVNKAYFYMLVSMFFVILMFSSPKKAEAFCCPQVYSIQLLPVDTAATIKMIGFAEINECLNMSFLHIVVRSSAPDGKLYIPTIPGREPLIGEWFAITNHRGETIWQNVTTFGVPAGGLTGKTLTITDENFVPVLQGIF